MRIAKQKAQAFGVTGCKFSGNFRQKFFRRLTNVSHSMVPAPFGEGRSLVLRQAIEMVLDGRLVVTTEVLEQAGERLSQMISIAPQDLLNTHLPQAIANLAEHSQQIFVEVMKHFFMTHDGMEEKFKSSGELQRDFFRLLAINQVNEDPNIQEQILEKIKPKSLPPSSLEETYSHALLAVLKYFADQVRGEFLGKPKPEADWLRFGQQEVDAGFEKTPLEVSHLLKRFHEVEKYQQVRREKLVKSIRTLAAVLSLYATYSFFQGLGHLFSVEFLQTCGCIVGVMGGWAFLQHLILSGDTQKEFRVSPFKHLPAHLSPAILERITLLTQTIDEVQQNIKTIHTWKKRLEMDGTRRLVGNRMITIVRQAQGVKITVARKDDEIFREGPRALKFEFSTEGFAALIAEHQHLKSLGEGLLATLKSQLNQLVILAKANDQMHKIEEVLDREIDVDSIALLADFLLLRKPLKNLNENKPSKADYTRFLERVAISSDVRPKRQ